MYSSDYLTAFGEGFVYADEMAITRVTIPDISRSGEQNQLSGRAVYLSESPLTRLAADLLQRYFSGEVISFEQLPVDLSSFSPFRRSVLENIRSISYGKTKSYREVAAICNSPLAFRAVGSALAANDTPIIIPCHRIIGSGGAMAGFSAPGGVHTKRLLLQMEKRQNCNL